MMLPPPPALLYAGFRSFATRFYVFPRRCLPRGLARRLRLPALLLSAASLVREQVFSSLTYFLDN